MSRDVRIALLDDKAEQELSNALFAAIHVYLNKIRALKFEPLNRTWEIPFGNAEPVHLHVQGISDMTEASTLLQNPERLGSFDLLLLDNDWTEGGGQTSFGLQLLERLDERRSRSGPILAMYSANDIEPEFVTRALQSGAEAFVSKREPTHMLNLLAMAIRRADSRSLENLAIASRDNFVAAEPILQSTTQAMQETMQLAALYALRESRPILIEGETGTGKSTVARAIRNASSRANAPMEILDLSAVPPELIASHLYGTLEGAFTGARTRDGVLGLAAGGTLFVDDLQNASREVQQTIHALLEENATYRRLGDRELRLVNVRFIFAANEDLNRLADEQRFKFDLLQRIGVLRLRMPPLRERRTDIPMLAKTLLAQQWNLDHKDSQPPELLSKAIERLQAHEWPGNIRELRNVMSRVSAVAAGTERLIDLMDIERAMITKGPSGTLADDDRQRLRRLALRNGSQRIVLDKLTAAPDGRVRIQELNESLDSQSADVDRASLALQSAISRLRQRLVALGFDIEHLTDSVGPAYCLRSRI